VKDLERYECDAAIATPPKQGRPTMFDDLELSRSIHCPLLRGAGFEKREKKTEYGGIKKATVNYRVALMFKILKYLF